MMAPVSVLKEDKTDVEIWTRALMAKVRLQGKEAKDPRIQEFLSQIL